MCTLSPWHVLSLWMTDFGGFGISGIELSAIWRVSMYVYVYGRGGPQTAPAPRPSLIYCALES
jgi:hypothetical protein